MDALTAFEIGMLAGLAVALAAQTIIIRWPHKPGKTSTVDVGTGMSEFARAVQRCADALEAQAQEEARKQAEPVALKLGPNGEILRA